MLGGGALFILGYITGYQDITTVTRGDEVIHMIKLHNGKFKVESEYKQILGVKELTDYQSRDIAT